MCISYKSLFILESSNASLYWQAIISNNDETLKSG